VSYKPRNKVSLVDSVVGQLREFIDRRQLSSGDRLPTEPELIAEFGVSRTVLRESLGRLQALGVLSVQHGRGTFVADREAISICAQLARSAVSVSPRDWVQYLEFRAAIECQAARLAASRATPEFCDDRQNDLSRMNDLDVPMLDAMQVDYNFHSKIVEQSGNELLRNSHAVIEKFIAAGLVQTACERPDPVAEKMHQDIIDALRANDPDAADRAMRVHMNAVDAMIKKVTGFQPTEPQPLPKTVKTETTFSELEGV
jgi:GntR family transcriptional regulator, transcriptional repressor for pyruvate dehydrogenase complex